MISIRNINPMVRAIGTMGAIAAVVGGVTFAQINTTSAVTLSDNTLTAATASLAIGPSHNCSTGATTSVPGMNFTNLQPGVESAAFPFCLENIGNVPLNITATVPNVFGNSTINPNDVLLHFTCGVGGATTGSINQSVSVGTLTGGQAFGTVALNNNTNNVLSCDVTAKITASSEQSGATLTPFDINFTGTTTDTQSPAVFNNTQV